MTATKDRFWAKVLFKEFIRHYRKMTPEQKVADIDESMDALEELDDSGDSFGAKMVRWSMERVEQYPMARENGKKGGRPKKNLSADGDTREDSLNVPDGSDAANLESSSSADTKIAGPAKNSYGEFGNVKMTTAEFEKLVQAEGADRANALIEELSSYLASSGKRYKSHYATLINWGRRKDKESKGAPKSFKQQDLDRQAQQVRDYFADFTKAVQHAG